MTLTSPQKFRKKPVVIEAMQWDGSILSHTYIHRWAGKSIDPEGDATRVIKIKTLEGVMTADEGDWIIKGIKGEFYPCKPEIFDATYELVSEGDTDA